MGKTVADHHTGTGCRRQALAHLGLGLCLLLPACGLFQALPSRQAILTTGLPPSAAAWIAAELCRQQFPAADPLPMHAHPPAYRLGPHHYRVRYSAHDGDGFRAIRNGRLAGPGGDATLRGCTFHPDARPTGNAGFALEEIYIDVRRTGAATVVTVELDGEPARGELLARLRRDLRVAERVEIVIGLLQAGHFDAAEACANGTLAALAADPAAPGRLVARLHFARALTALRRDALAPAATALAAALDADPRLTVARRLWTRTRERLAATAGSDPATLAAEAARRLAAGDLAGAECWSRQALAHTPDSAIALRTLAATAERRGDHRRALVEELLALERHGFDPDLVLSLATRYAALGDRPAGLRLLLRYRAQLDRTAQQPALAAIARISELLPREMLARIHQTSGSAADEAVRFEPDSAKTHLFRRLAALRRDHADRADPGWHPTIRDGYRTAPGVVPAAPGRSGR